MSTQIKESELKDHPVIAIDDWLPQAPSCS